MKTQPRIGLCIRLLLTGLALLTPLSSAPAAGMSEPVQSKGSYRSGGQSIRFTRFEPARKGTRPAILLLHGVDGADANRTIYESLATTLTTQGYSVFFVHYFDAFVGRDEELTFYQTNVKDELFAPDNARRDRVFGSFKKCLEVVKDGLRHIHTQPNVDTKRVGIVGLSMGGFLAVSAATQADLKVAVVVELFGGLPREFHGQTASLPPTFILHGDQDRIVPVHAAHELAQFLMASERQHEVVIYKGVDHVFVSESGKFDHWSALSAVGRTTGFLQKHLK